MLGTKPHPLSGLGGSLGIFEIVVVSQDRAEKMNESESKTGQEFVGFVGGDFNTFVVNSYALRKALRLFRSRQISTLTQCNADS